MSINPALPQFAKLLEAAGYRRETEAECKHCGAPIAWWKTHNDKPMPMEDLGNDRFQAHFDNCKKRQAEKSNGVPRAQIPRAPASSDKLLDALELMRQAIQKLELAVKERSK